MSLAGSNFPMALDQSTGQVLTAFRNPATLGAFSTDDGTLTASGSHEVHVVFVGVRPSRVRADWSLRDCLNTAARYAVGSVLPASVVVAPLPATAAVRVPAVQPYRYATVDGRVLLVDPVTNAVVADITP